MGPITPFIQVPKKCTMTLKKYFGEKACKKDIAELLLFVKIANKLKSNIKCRVFYYKKSKFLLGNRKSSIWIM